MSMARSRSIVMSHGLSLCTEVIRVKSNETSSDDCPSSFFCAIAHLLDCYSSSAHNEDDEKGAYWRDEDAGLVKEILDEGNDGYADRNPEKDPLNAIQLEIQEHAVTRHDEIDEDGKRERSGV